MACSNSCGNRPSVEEKFRTLVIGVIRISMQSINRNAGQESSGPDLIGEDLIIFIAKSSDNRKKSREHASGGSLRVMSLLQGPSGTRTWVLFKVFL